MSDGNVMISTSKRQVNIKRLMNFINR